MSSINNKMVYGSLFVGTIAMFCVAITVQAQYNTYDSDSNSDSDGGPILTNAELGKLVRNSAKVQANNRHNQQQQFAAATRNLYNKQQPLQYAPSYNNKRSHGYGDSSSLNGYGPVMGAASHGRGSNANNDDDDESGSSNYGPNFGSNFDNSDDGEGSGANGGESSPINLNQAASGYPGQGNDYSNEGAGAGFGFGGSSGYGPSVDGSEFGPEGFSNEGRRAKSASSLMGARNYGSDDDAGASQYGPNSAVNSRDVDDDSGRTGYAPEGQGDNDNDDE